MLLLLAFLSKVLGDAVELSLTSALLGLQPCDARAAPARTLAESVPLLLSMIELFILSMKLILLWLGDVSMVVCVAWVVPPKKLAVRPAVDRYAWSAWRRRHRTHVKTRLKPLRNFEDMMLYRMGLMALLM